MQIVDCQLFKKIQLAFNHVRIPLKSELNFGKPLIINNLAKHNSLQTFSGGQRISAGERTAGQSMKEEKPRRRVGIGFCRYILPVYFAGIFFNLTASRHSHNILTSNILPKSHLRLGTLESTQRQPRFCNLLIIKRSKNRAMAMGREIRWPVEAKPRQVALLAALLTSGFRNGAESQKYPHRSAFLSNFI